MTGAALYRDNFPFPDPNRKRPDDDVMDQVGNGFFMDRSLIRRFASRDVKPIGQRPVRVPFIKTSRKS